MKYENIVKKMHVLSFYLYSLFIFSNHMIKVSLINYFRRASGIIREEI
jgi:hypothetical protein